MSVIYHKPRCKRCKHIICNVLIISCKEAYVQCPFCGEGHMFEGLDWSVIPQRQANVTQGLKINE